jgi:hypothetical protein
MEFLGSTIGRDDTNFGNPVYDAIYLGKGARSATGLVRFTGLIGISGDGVAKYRYFGADPSATLAVTFDGAQPQSRDMLYPDYDHVTSNRQVTLGDWTIDDADFSPPDCLMPFERRNMLESNVENCDGSRASQVVVPSGRWWLASLSLYPSAPSSDVQCTVDVLAGPPGGRGSVIGTAQFPTRDHAKPGQVLEVALNHTIDSGRGPAQAVMLRVTDKKRQDLCAAGAGRCRCHQARWYGVINALRYPGGTE